MSTTTWQEVYRDSPRIKEIEAVFAFIANPNVTVDEICRRAQQNNDWA